ncbi:hypothetical protein TNCV_4193021 [Trichonephila clavipes]|nr:hypothetical protein TNCV_4193021 [Trichonephila clavipes]
MLAPPSLGYHAPPGGRAPQFEKHWVRAPDSTPEGLSSMPVQPNTLRVLTEFVLVKSVDPKVLWAESRMQELEKIALHFSSMPMLWKWS